MAASDTIPDGTGRQLVTSDEDPVHVTLPGPSLEGQPIVLEHGLDLMEEIGRGGMGAVLLGRERDLNRIVAVKVLSDTTRPVLVRRFITEAQITAQLEHPNIVPVYRMEEDAKGAPAFSMKVVRGMDLRKYVTSSRERARKGLPPEAVFDLNRRLEVFAQVCDAMSYAHSKGVIHRDLKPENIMVGAYNEVYVMDWGIARVVGREDEEIELPTLTEDAPEEAAMNATRVGEVVGTPAYMSPEQARADRDAIGPASDQYALGLVLYELCCLQRARRGLTGMQTIFAAQRGHLPPPTHVSDRPIPADLVAIIARATAPGIDARYPSIRHLAEDVRRFLHGEEVSVRRHGLIERTGRWASRRPTLMVSLIAGSVLLGGGFIASTAIAALAFEHQATARSLAMTQLVEATHGKAHAMDVTLLKYESLMDGLAHQVEAQRERGTPDESLIFWMDDAHEGKLPRGMGPVLRYGNQNIHFSLPIVSTTPDVTKEDVRDEVALLAPVFPAFRTALLRSHSEESVHWDRIKQQRLLRVDGVPAQWVYVGLESGVLANYPANDQISPDYDVTKRPWYLATREKHEPHWGKPYFDDSGSAILVPCNEALLDSDGEMFGVMGIDVSLKVVLEMLVLDVPGVRAARLVDADGTIVVDSSQAELKARTGLNNNQAIGTESIQSQGVLAALAGGLENGHVEDDTGIHVFSRLSSVGWWYVVDVDPSALGSLSP